MDKDIMGFVDKLIQREKVKPSDSYSSDGYNLAFCSVCKKEVGLNDIFCFNCGQRLKKSIKI